MFELSELWKGDRCPYQPQEVGKMMGEGKEGAMIRLRGFSGDHRPLHRSLAPVGTSHWIYTLLQHLSKLELVISLERASGILRLLGRWIRIKNALIMILDMTYNSCCAKSPALLQGCTTLCPSNWSYLGRFFSDYSGSGTVEFPSKIRLEWHPKCSRLIGTVMSHLHISVGCNLKCE